MATKVLGKQSGKNKEKKASTDKPKSTKSRFGCLTCKKRRLKCDETKPSCINCLKKKVECGGYATNFKWMAFKDDNEDTKPKPANGPKTFKEHLELASISVTGKSIKEIKQENDLISQGLNPDSYKKRKSSVGIEQGDDTQIMKRPRSCSFESPIISPSADQRMGISRSLSATTPIPTEIHDFRSEYSKSSHNLNSLAEAAIDEIHKSPGPPSNISMKEPSSPSGQVPYSPGFSDFMLKSDRDKHHDVSLTPSLTALINFACNNNDPKSNFDLDNFKLNSTGPMSPFNLSTLSHLDDNHAHTNTKSSTHNSGVGMTFDPISGPSSISASSPSFQPSLGSVSDTLAGKIKLLSAGNSPIESINSPPSVMSDSPSHRSLMKTSDQEQILHLYSSYTCTIMSIKNGTDENPWRNMILPLASKYSCLFNSIASMTLFHLAGNHELSSTAADLRAKGFDYMKRCIVDLATGLSRSRDSESKSELPADIALATCLNLAVGESWDTQISSGIAHLKGAKSMIQEILNILKEQQSRISKKKLQWSNSPSPDDKEYQELIHLQKSEMSNKLVLLDNSEWERIFHQSEEAASGENEKALKSSAITVPKSLQFLFNIWIYFEVLAQMTTDTNNDDKGIDLVATITTMLQSPKNQKKQEVKSRKIRQVDSECGGFSDPASPSLKSDSGESNASGESGGRNGLNIFDSFESFSHNSEYVDPLLGCAQSLFSLMGRVAALISKIRKARKTGTSSRNSLSTITAAAALKQELNEWKPTITPSMISQANSGVMYDDIGSGTWDISSCIATAEAYKYATLIYLHQAVPEIPSLSSHQLAEKIFILMASIPTTSHLFVVHIFPLLVGSCEAEPGEEREWCEARWELLSQRMWIGNIDKALEVVKEVWSRKDEYSNKKRRSEVERDELKFKINSGDDQDGRLRNISSQLTGLMSVVNNISNSSVEDIIGGITSPFHWSTVMKEWGWEVLLG